MVTVIGLAVLTAFGYVEQLDGFQPARAQQGIWIVMSILPAVGYVVMLVIMLFFYKLKESDVQAMIEANQANSGIIDETVTTCCLGTDGAPADPEVFAEPFIEE